MNELWTVYVKGDPYTASQIACERDVDVVTAMSFGDNDSILVCHTTGSRLAQWVLAVGVEDWRLPYGACLSYAPAKSIRLAYGQARAAS